MQKDLKHNDIIKQEFAKQSERFGEEGIPLTSEEYLSWMVGSLPLKPEFRVLDVATGTGHLSLSVAPRVREVVGIDITPEMLHKARKEMEKRGIKNVILQEGSAERLPYNDGFFDMVVSRLAVHHFESPSVQIKEMVRVCKKGHIVGVIDLFSPDRGDLAESYNFFERLRDPSHTRALTGNELADLMAKAGLNVFFKDFRDIEVNLKRWLNTTGTPGNESGQITAAMEEELKGSSKTGMRPFKKNGELMFFQTWGILLGARA